MPSPEEILVGKFQKHYPSILQDHHQKHQHVHPYLLELIVDPSKQELFVRDFEDVGLGFSGKAEHPEPIAINWLQIMAIMTMMSMVMIVINC